MAESFRHVSDRQPGGLRFDFPTQRKSLTIYENKLLARNCSVVDWLMAGWLWEALFASNFPAACRFRYLELRPAYHLGALDLGRVRARNKAADARSEASLAFYECTV